MADGSGNFPWVSIITAAVIGGVAGFALWHWALPTQSWGAACIPVCAIFFGLGAAFLPGDFWEWVNSFLR